MQINWWYHVSRWAVRLACISGAAGIVLKATGCVDWSWWRVISPFAFSMMLILLMLGLTADCLCRQANLMRGRLRFLDRRKERNK